MNTFQTAVSRLPNTARYLSKNVRYLSKTASTLVAISVTCCVWATPNAFASSDKVIVESLYPAVMTSTAPSLAMAGDYPVGVTTVMVTNPDQLDVKDFKLSKDRDLTLEVWYPAKLANNEPLATYDNETRLGKPFSIRSTGVRDAEPDNSQARPLVVLSHGYTGYRTIMYYLGEHLASHGYTVVSIDHTDSTNQDVDFVNSPFSGFVSTLYNRPRDQQFILDHAASANNLLVVAGKALNIDTDRASVIGFSMGGYGALNTVGGCYDFTMEHLRNIGFPAPVALLAAPLLSGCTAGRDAADPRWQAMVALAPWGQEHDIHQVSKINVPSLIIAGEKDDISGYEPGVKTLFDALPANDKFMLVYENARHNVAPHPAPAVAYEVEGDYGHYADPVWSNQIMNMINNHMILAFLDCYIGTESTDAEASEASSNQSRDAACAMLPTRMLATQEKNEEGEMSKPWPGFIDRWSVGMQFHRK